MWGKPDYEEWKGISPGIAGFFFFFLIGDTIVVQKASGCSESRQKSIAHLLRISELVCVECNWVPEHTWVNRACWGEQTVGRIVSKCPQRCTSWLITPNGHFCAGLMWRLSFCFCLSVRDLTEWIESPDSQNSPSGGQWAAEEPGKNEWGSTVQTKSSFC